MAEQQYGFLLLERENSGKAFQIRGICETLHVNMLKCVEEASMCYANNRNMKIGYFQILSNGQLVKALHSAPANCRLEEMTRHSQ